VRNRSALSTECRVVLEVEQPVHQFMKIITNLRTGLEWRLTEAIAKEELQDKDLKFKWTILWNMIKRQNGIRYTSMRKNRRLGGLF
ncbi:19793_t:CDS:1, partial [Gigaspora rosea]